MENGVALVADIGRQSVRFGLAGGPEGAAPREIKRFSNHDHQTFTSALVSYLADVGLRDARLPSVLAVAGAVRGDLINLTGSRWYISLAGVEAVLRQKPMALNECAANALALSQLPMTAFTGLSGPSPRPISGDGNYAVIGVGTGLGVAALIGANGHHVPVQSEAGHIGFAPQTGDEERFASFCKARGMLVEVETLVSANGLLLAYEALSGGKRLPSPEDVTRNVSRDPVCAAVVRMFVDHLGAFVGDLVLTFDAWDGVYLTGAIARALESQLKEPGFRRRMEARTAFRRQLADTPVALVNRNDLELIGAAAAIRNA
ncbi:glucokinase [Sphingomonas sp. TDK1]|uniref:glucokinase n=1 Tax=Sphingomonas sp. TDK1 TaxID=453247 RepID=UPI0007D8ED03|nr:ROK family protein [Sphingomonas sp. TDK1]OAN58858.1 glucokinase [Sphingomonas sp. TDK1]